MCQQSAGGATSLGIDATPVADHQHGVGGPPWVFHQVVWVYDSNMGASTLGCLKK